MKQYNKYYKSPESETISEYDMSFLVYEYMSHAAHGNKMVC